MNVPKGIVKKKEKNCFVVEHPFQSVILFDEIQIEKKYEEQMIKVY